MQVKTFEQVPLPMHESVVQALLSLQFLGRGTHKPLRQDCGAHKLLPLQGIATCSQPVDGLQESVVQGLLSSQFCVSVRQVPFVLSQKTVKHIVELPQSF